jgi:hypothetical protein
LTKHQSKFERTMNVFMMNPSKVWDHNLPWGSICKVVWNIIISIHTILPKKKCAIHLKNKKLRFNMNLLSKNKKVKTLWIWLYLKYNTKYNANKKMICKNEEFFWETNHFFNCEDWLGRLGLHKLKVHDQPWIFSNKIRKNYFFPLIR